MPQPRSGLMAASAFAPLAPVPNIRRCHPGNAAEISTAPHGSAPRAHAIPGDAKQAPPHSVGLEQELLIQG